MPDKVKRVGFTPKTAGRVMRATREVEQQAKQREEANYGSPVRERRGFWIEVTQADVLDDNQSALRWKHVRRIAGGWEDHPDGLVSSTSDPDTRRNSIEANNSNTGVQGNGVDVANLTGTFVLKPPGVGPALWVYVDHDPSTGVILYTVEHVNQVDGGCEEEE